MVYTSIHQTIELNIFQFLLLKYLGMAKRMIFCQKEFSLTSTQLLVYGQNHRFFIKISKLDPYTSIHKALKLNDFQFLLLRYSGMIERMIFCQKNFSVTPTQLLVYGQNHRFPIKISKLHPYTSIHKALKLNILEFLFLKCSGMAQRMIFC